MDALVDILIKLMEKNPEKLHCMVVPSTMALIQAQQIWCPKLRRNHPPCSYQWLLRHAQDPFELKKHLYCTNTLHTAFSIDAETYVSHNTLISMLLRHIWHHNTKRIDQILIGWGPNLHSALMCAAIYLLPNIFCWAGPARATRTRI
jgi:hypothetical protein